MLAVTTVYPGERRDLPLGDQRIREADIEVNAVDFRWSLDGQGLEDASNRRDLVTALVHEIGHALGFAHSCNEFPVVPWQRPPSHRLAHCSVATEPARASVMYPEARCRPHVRRRLSPEDVRSLCSAYPRVRQFR
jgi:hypothetical protein